MENGTILIAVIIGAVLGRKSILIGCVAGFATNLLCYFVFNEFALKAFLVETILGFVFIAIAATLAHLFFPGLKGGNHNTGPSFLGISSGKGSITRGGIIHTDEERKNIKDNERNIP